MARKICSQKSDLSFALGWNIDIVKFVQYRPTGDNNT